jgi:uncharacterized sulfatase
MQAVHMDGFKGVRYDIKSHDDPFIIHDLQQDPIESQDLAKNGGRFNDLQQQMHYQVLQMRRPNPSPNPSSKRSSKRSYDREPVPALDADKLDDNYLQGGFDATIYLGDFSYVPDAIDLTPVKTNRVEKVQPINIPGKSGMMQWNGYIEVR